MDKFTQDFQNLNINEKDKNKKKNKKKKNGKNKEKEIKEKPKEELTEEEIFKEELTNLKEKLRELKILFSPNEVKTLNEDKIENFIILEDLIDYSKIKQKLLECFPNEDIFSYLLQIWEKIIKFYEINMNESDKINKIIEENEDIDDLDKKDKKTKNKSLGYFYNKLLMNLNFFVPKIISNTKDENFKNKVCETIIPNFQLIKSIEDGENFLYYFINDFNIKNNLKLKIEKEYKDKFIENLNYSFYLGLNIVNLLDLQEMIPLENIFKIISDNYFLVSYHIYSLLAKAYIKNNEKNKFLIIDNLFKLIEGNKNLVNFELIYNIINKDFKNDKEKDELIKKFIKSIKINLDKPIRVNNIDNSIYYCKLMFENPHLFQKEDIIQAKKYICDNYFNSLKVNEWKTNLNKLNLFEYEDLKGYLSLENLESYYYQLPMGSVDQFIKILKFMPKEIPKLLKEYMKEYNYDAGAKIIKKLDYPDHKIPEFFTNERIYKFFNYKIANCRDDNNPYTLIQYCLISQKMFDISIAQLVNQYKKFYRNNKFYLYVINEVYYGALDRKYKFDRKIKREIEYLFEGIKYVDNYTIEDHFGPIDKNCIQIDPKKTEVFFINNTNEFEGILKKYFINSKYIGIDTEWRQCFEVKDIDNMSIMQLSTDDEKCCIILDMLKLQWENKFYEIFIKYFTGKIFVGFSFNKNDLAIMPSELRKFFEDNNCCTIYDLVLIYKQKYLEKCQSLKLVTEKILGKSLCKIEQCSDWDVRPLSKCQIHYAALDALICIILFKKIISK